MVRVSMRILKKHIRPFLDAECICKRVTRQNYKKRDSLNPLANDVKNRICKRATYETVARLQALMREKLHGEISEEDFVFHSQALVSNSGM